MDTKTAGIISTALKLIVGIIGVILCVMIISNGESIEAYGEETKFVDYAIYLVYFGMAIAIGAALLFGLVYFVTNIKKSLGAVVGLLGMAVIAGISYGIAKGDLTENYISAGVTESVSKLSGMGIWAVGILLAIAIAAVILGEVRNLAK